jgi:tetratricopeptide (TPR) repeat protein
MRRDTKNAHLFVLVVALLAAAHTQAQVNPSARQLFEAGQNEEALGVVTAARDAGTANPADSYLAAQILVKLARRAEARAELSRLTTQADPVWKAIAESAGASLDGNRDAALAAAEKAAAVAPALFFASYQLGLVKAQREDWPGAADAFERAAMSDPTFAYAHYYGGLAYSRAKRPDRMAVHFELFLKLAPKAPERLAVESLMRTVRGK